MNKTYTFAHTHIYILIAISSLNFIDIAADTNCCKNGNRTYSEYWNDSDVRRIRNKHDIRKP